MKNPLYSAVHHATTKMNQRNETLNGESPAFLEYKENGRPAKLETLEINADHCHSFIGKMKYQGESIYSEKVLTTLLQFFFDHTSKGEKIVIELANKVSELVNGEESMQGYMDFDTQKGELKRIAKKLNKKRWKDLEIQDISDNNVQLFSLLSEKGIQGLATDTLPPLNAEIDSLGVAQHLYAITQQDPAYLAEFKKLKPHALEDISRNVDYYSLVELSIRINALLHGVDVQGGVKRQEKYDKFLLQHLSYNPKHEQFPALQEFQKFCEQQLQGTSFKALYFDTGKSEKYMDKIWAKQGIITDTLHILYLVLALGVGAGLYAGASHYRKQKEDQRNYRKIIRTDFTFTPIPQHSDMGNWWIGGEFGESLEYKLDRIERYVDDMYQRFLLRYGDKGNFSEIEFKTELLEALKTQNALDKLGVDPYSGLAKMYGTRSGNSYAYLDEILDDYIQEHQGRLSVHEIPLFPYKKFDKYEQEFTNTLLSDKEIILRWPYKKQFGGTKTYHGNILKKMETVPSSQNTNFKLSDGFLSELGDFLKKGEYYEDLGMVKFFRYTDQNTGETSIVAGWIVSNSANDAEVTLSTAYAKECIMDLFKQRYPIFNQLIRQYQTRYMDEWDTHAGITGRTRLDWWKEGNQIQELLLKFILSQKDYKLTLLNRPHIPLYELNELIDQFVIENADMDKLAGPRDPKIQSCFELAPSRVLQKSESAMRHTLDITFPTEEETYVFGTDLEERRNEKYQASDGKIYHVGVKKNKKGTEFFYATDEANGDSGCYLLSTGQKVAKDYFAQKEKFLTAKEIRDESQSAKQIPRQW